MHFGYRGDGWGVLCLLICDGNRKKYDCGVSVQISAREDEIYGVSAREREGSYKLWACRCYCYYSWMFPVEENTSGDFIPHQTRPVPSGKPGHPQRGQQLLRETTIGCFHRI